MIEEKIEEIEETGEAAPSPESEGSPSESEPEVSEAPIESENETAEETNYAEILKADMRELTEEFSASSEIKITDLKNPLRYGALRDLGLTPREAYLASGGRKEKTDNRSHLSSSVPRKMASPFSEIPRAELDAARELFADMSDSEIRNLYKKVTQ